MHVRVPELFIRRPPYEAEAGVGGWVSVHVRVAVLHAALDSKKKITSSILENKLLIWCSFYGLCICIAGCGWYDQRSR